MKNENGRKQGTVCNIDLVNGGENSRLPLSGL